VVSERELQEIVEGACRREASAVSGMLLQVTARSPFRSMGADNIQKSRLERGLHASIKDNLPLIKKRSISS
jgi:hypothetical protein